MTNDRIEWRGGLCPVNEDAIVEIRLRGDRDTEGMAGRFEWGHGRNWDDSDIVAFRFADGYDGDDTVKWREQNYCPVSPDTFVEITLESGLKVTRRGRHIVWDDQQHNPIISFRIVKTEQSLNVKEKKNTKTLKVLTEEGLELQEEFESRYGKNGNCSCHTGNPPCSSCTHPGHPISLEESKHLWRIVEVSEEEIIKPSRTSDLIWGSW